MRIALWISPHEGFRELDRDQLHRSGGCKSQIGMS